jgi:1,2-phenylacetyl-CoA epoxidase PaaB subunit
MRLTELNPIDEHSPNPMDALWKTMVGFQHGGTVYFETTVQAASEEQAVLLARDAFNETWGTLLKQLPLQKMAHVDVTRTEKPSRWQVNLGFKRGEGMIHYVTTVTASKHHGATLKARDGFERVLRRLQTLPKLTDVRVRPQNPLAQQIAQQNARKHLTPQPRKR